MFTPYFVDSTGKKHTFPDDFALKGGLVLAWRRGESVFDYRYRLKSSYTGGRDYQLHSIHQSCDGFTVQFSHESAIGGENYCL